MKVPRILQAASLLIIGTCALAMPPPQQSISRDEARQLQTPTFTYRVTVVSRSVQAVNYRNRGSATTLGFKGTDLMPAAHAQARVHSKKGYTSIEVEFHELDNPTTFGREYLTYVLWAITPEGRSVNLGELVVGGRSSKLDVTTELQAFALIVTAEPYYAVRRPSNVVVLENEVREDTVGSTQAVNAKYELLERGGYIPTGYNFDPVVMNAKLPLEFFEARNALRIAQSEGAEQYASDTYQHAVRLTNQAEGYATENHVDKKTFISVSKEATQTAEDAREISVKRMEAERIDAEAWASAAREANAKAQTISAVADTANALRARDEADRQKREAQASALQQQQTAQADAAAAAAASEQKLQQAEREREELRARLLQQFNAILETRDTARGLVVNMSDVLFDTAKHTLRPLAREKLAKISGILLAYPGLALGIEGNTDSVGGDAYNQGLSERRAEAVRSYLAEQGVPASSMTAKGFGKTQPVSSNGTAEGRQQNRRVELIVSGEVIGTTISSVILPQIR